MLQSPNMFVSLDPSGEPQTIGDIQASKAYNDAREAVSRWLLKDEQHVAWSDVIGNERAKRELREAIEADVKHPDLYAHYGMKPPKGALLWGGPGNGKTMLAKATASALAELFGAKPEMISISGPELENKYVGETEKYIRNIFKYARLYAEKHKRPLVIFMDEADSILMTRTGQWPWRDGVISQFLSEMDGLKPNGAFVILATNRPEAIDPAFLRPGRIDSIIQVARPTQEECGEILITLINKEADKNVGWWTHSEFSVREVAEYIFDPAHLIEKIKGVSGAEYHFTLAHIISGAMVVNLLARAKQRAFRRDLEARTMSGITFADWKSAIDDLFEEQRQMAHDYAKEEFLTELALPIEKRRLEGGTVQ